MPRHNFTPRYLLPGLVLILTGLAANQWTIYRNASTIQGHQVKVEHSQRVFSKVELVRAAILEAESSVRSFVISHRSAQLDPYYAAVKQLPARLADLEDELSDNPRQLSRMQQLRTVLEPRLLLLRELLRNEEAHPDDNETTLRMVDEGTARQNEIRALLDTMMQDERGQLQLAAQAKDRALDNATGAFYAASLFMPLLTLIAYFLLRSQLSERSRHDWMTAHLNHLNQHMRDLLDTPSFCRTVLDFLSKALDAPVSLFFLEKNGQWTVAEGLALPPGLLHQTFAADQGLIGEAVRRRQLMVANDPAAAHAAITSGARRLEPAHVAVIPLEFEGRALGAIELCSLQPFSPVQQQLLESLRPALGSGLHSVLARDKVQLLLEQTQSQAEELQAQQEELQSQSEELRQSNEELEQQARALEEQQLQTAQKNQQLETQTSQLTVANQYKSQFLANMSHELRTPLNSLLILSSLLADNKGGRLTDQEVEFARTIHNSGNDLLALINDILDLAKIESGNVRLELETVAVSEILENLDRVYRPAAEDKGLKLEIVSHLPADANLRTDRLRLEQILRNFLSNALKFTPSGSIKVSLQGLPDGLEFSVLDSGIGIPEEKLEQIFEAFQQADGSTSRLYGGTGLGLTISREIASLFGGRIEVTSRPGQGSCFKLILPAQAPSPAQAAVAKRVTAPAPLEEEPAEPYLLLVEDDQTFGETLQTMAREAGFRVRLMRDGESALALAEAHPPLAVILDVKLPTLSGLAVLQRLKAHPRTRHVPVHMLSGVDHTMQALRLGAMGYLVKPATREQVSEVMGRILAFTNRSDKTVLIVEDDRLQRESLTALLQSSGIACQSVSTGAEAFERIQSGAFDCVILDLKLPDTDGFELLKRMEGELQQLPPVVVYTGKDLTRKEEEELRKYSESIILKGVRSPERLLEEVGLFLHRLQSGAPVETPATSTRPFAGRRILLADDDLRNTFALMSVLEPEGFEATVVRNGREALQALEADPSLELVLMDIMMPEMDGLEATRMIRQNAKWRNLPVIALTAKAMKDDQDRCLEAGANDYLTKPFKIDHLLSLLRVWLPPASFARD